MELVHTKDYLLLIDKEVELETSDHVLSLINKPTIIDIVTEVDENAINGLLIKWTSRKHCAKIIASLPEIEGLPLLPPFEEEIDIEQLAKDTILTENIIPTSNIHGQIVGFQIGYKAAQSHSKQFSLEDMKKAWNNGFKQGVKNPDNPITNNEREIFIQSLSTPKVPKEFIPEYEIVYEKNREFYGSGMFNKHSKKLKTITNSEGKQQLVGNYKY